MTTIDRSFVDGIFWRILALGAVTALATALLISWHFAYSVVLGALLSATSLRVTAVAVERLIESVVDGSKPGAGWGVLLAVKLLALLFAVFVCLALLDAHPVAFVLGFKLLLPAVAWQAFRSPEHLEGTADDDTNDKESS